MNSVWLNNLSLKDQRFTTSFAKCEFYNLRDTMQRAGWDQVGKGLRDRIPEQGRLHAQYSQSV